MGKELTAVDFYSKEHLKLLIRLENKELSLGEYVVEHRNLLEQSKEMEKKQIMDAYSQGHEDGYHFEGSRSDYESEGLANHLAEQYYNETYKKD